jgi:hypothetical protein
MTKTIENLSFYLIYVFDLLIIIQVLFLFSKKIDRKILWLLFVYCVVNSSCNLIQTLFTFRHSGEYLILLGFTLIEYFILALFFVLITNNKKFHKVIYLFSSLFLVIVLLNYDSGKSQSIDSVPIGVETILVLIYSFYYLYEQMNIIDNSFIYNRYHFWMVIGVMTYLGGSFFIYIFTNQARSEVLDDYWFLTYIFYIVKNIFFFIGLSIYSKPTIESTHKKLKPYLN